MDATWPEAFENWTFFDAREEELRAKEEARGTTAWDDDTAIRKLLERGTDDDARREEDPRDDDDDDDTRRGINGDSLRFGL